MPSARAGGVIVTGHDPDDHAHFGPNKPGAFALLHRYIAWVARPFTPPGLRAGSVETPSSIGAHAHRLRLLLVTDTRSPGGRDHCDPRRGLRAAGLTVFDVASAGPPAQGVLDLRAVVFRDYDAILVASDYGGWLRQDEVDVLVARLADVLDFVNAGGGLVVLNESGTRPPRPPGVYPGVQQNRYGFLPFLNSIPALTEKGIVLRPAGRAIGLKPADVTGNAAHSVFLTIGGMSVIDIDSKGRPITLATRACLTQSGTDRDCDGLIDEADNCPDDANHTQEDLDADSLGDACDSDDDGDHVPDAKDLCPRLADQGQEDDDHDGQGNACDPDDDDDGVADRIDLCPGTRLPEPIATGKLVPGRYAVTSSDGKFMTVTTAPGPRVRNWTIADTRGCSCTQIVNQTSNPDPRALQQGCSVQLMEDFISTVPLGP